MGVARRQILSERSKIRLAHQKHRPTLLQTAGIGAFHGQASCAAKCHSEITQSVLHITNGILCAIVVFAPNYWSALLILHHWASDYETLRLSAAPGETFSPQYFLIFYQKMPAVPQDLADLEGRRCARKK